jgi:hypothetical protein
MMTCHCFPFRRARPVGTVLDVPQPVFFFAVDAHPEPRPTFDSVGLHVGGHPQALAAIGVRCESLGEGAEALGYWLRPIGRRHMRVREKRFNLDESSDRRRWRPRQILLSVFLNRFRMALVPVPSNNSPQRLVFRLEDREVQ